MLAKIFRNYIVFTVFFKNPESESGIRESVSILTKKSGIRKSRIRTKNVTDCQPWFILQYTYNPFPLKWGKLCMGKYLFTFIMMAKSGTPAISHKARVMY